MSRRRRPLAVFPLFQAPGGAAEISRRTAGRIERIRDELRRVVKVLERRGGRELNGVRSELGAAMGAIDRAAGISVVPLVHIRGLP